MDDIVTEEVGSILRVQLNRPTKRNAMTSAMYALARIFSEVAHDENMRVAAADSHHRRIRRKCAAARRKGGVSPT
jgi:enoyl-CoA hydratase/carnithine racemase